MKLFLSGKKGQPVGRALSPLLAKAKKLLDESQDGELFTPQQLATLVGCYITTLHRSQFQLPGYFHKVRSNQTYWGKPKTIQQLQKEVK